MISQMHHNAQPRFHITLSGNMEDILETGLNPAAPKLYRCGHPTPTFGGVYFTTRITDFPNIIKNIARTGRLARNSLYILSFSNEQTAFVDEDDFFGIDRDDGDWNIIYIGKEDIDISLQDKIISLWKEYLSSPDERQFFALKDAIYDFYQKAPRNPAKGHLLQPVLPEDIVVEAELQPYLDEDNNTLVWKGVQGGECLSVYKELLNWMNMPLQAIDHHYPYDCCLPLLHDNWFSAPQICQ